MEEVFDGAAAFLDAGNLRWPEYWSTPRIDLNRYADALRRRAARQET